MLKDTVTKFAEAKVQGEVELKKAGGGQKKAAAGHYNHALDQMASLLEHLPSEHADSISKQLEEIRSKMKKELGVGDAPEAVPSQAQTPLEAEASAPTIPPESKVKSDPATLVPDEGLAELYRATEGGGRLGEALKTGSSVFVLREAAPPGDHLGYHFEARGGALAVHALVTFEDEESVDVCFEDGAELEGLSLEAVAPRTEIIEPSADTTDAAVAYHRRRAAAGNQTCP